MIELGKVHIDLVRREVIQDGSPVALGSRAFDILEILIKANGALVSKNELMDRVWPNTVVEENNLQVHIFALRKILGDHREAIRTVQGRGYRLIREKVDGQLPPQTASQHSPRDLPVPASQLLGREEAVGLIAASLRSDRIVTLVGAGGIGKTRLAIRVAHEILGSFRDGVRFVELAAVSETETVLVAMAESCGLRFTGGEVSVVRIAEALVGEQCLIVIDNAEHVTEVVASLVSALTRSNDQLRVLVTSREPVCLPDERVVRVPPLAVPGMDAPIAEVLQSTAVQLFLARAKALGCVTIDDDQSIHLIGQICRRLDGIPLAIELAAARAATLGVTGVLSLLDDRLQLLAGGDRNVPRHQTLRATLDWSFKLLDEASRSVFRRLSIFAGLFALDGVRAVAIDQSSDLAQAIEKICELVNKSLVNVEFEGSTAHYRLPESTRAYAMEKIRDEGDLRTTIERHVRFLSEKFEVFLRDKRGHENAGFRSELSRFLDDARGSFDWAFSENGDARLGILLAATFVPMLLECSLVEECYSRAARAVEAIDKMSSPGVEMAEEMGLRAALATTTLLTRGPVCVAAGLWKRVLESAIRQEDREYEGLALWGSWNTMLSSSDITSCMKFAALYQEFVERDGNRWQKVQAKQLIAFSMHFMGKHQVALETLEQTFIELGSLNDEVPRGGGFTVNPTIYNYGTRARIVWLQGCPDRAIEMVEETVALVCGDTLEPALSHVLAVAAVPLATFTGDFKAARHYLDLLRDQLTLHCFEIWHEYHASLEAQLDVLTGNINAGLPRLEQAIDALLGRGYRRLLTPSIALCAETLARCGRTNEARARLRDALEYCEVHGELLFTPELWRVAAVIELADIYVAGRGGLANVAAAEDRAVSYLGKAIAIAKDHGSKMFELRASISFARLLIARGDNVEASVLLEKLAPSFDRKSVSLDIQALYALIDNLKSVNPAPADSSALCDSVFIGVVG